MVLRKRSRAGGSPNVRVPTSCRARPARRHWPPWTEPRSTGRRWTPGGTEPWPCMPRPVDDPWRGRCRRGRVCDWCSCRSHRLPGRRPVSRQHSTPRKKRMSFVSSRQHFPISPPCLRVPPWRIRCYCPLVTSRKHLSSFCYRLRARDCCGVPSQGCKDASPGRSSKLWPAFSDTSPPLVSVSEEFAAVGAATMYLFLISRREGFLVLTSPPLRLVGCWLQQQR